MKDSRTQLPSLVQITSSRLLLWGMLLCVVSVAVLGSFFFFIARSEFEKRSEAISASLAKYVENYVEGALTTLHHTGFELEMLPGATREQATQSLRRAWEANPRFSRLLLIDADRIIVASVPTGRSNVDFAIPLQMLEGKHMMQGRPVPLEDGKGMVVHLAHKMSDGRLLVGALKLNDIQLHIAGLQPSKGETVILTDAWGTVMAHPEERVMQQQENIGNLPFYGPGGISGKSLFIHLHGQSYLASATAIPSIQWVLIFQTPSSAVYAETMRSLSWFIFFLLVLYTVFAVLVGAEMRRNILRPFSELTASMRRLAGGDFSIDENRTDTFEELASLRNTFTHMVRQLQARETDLKKTRLYIKNIIDSMPSIIIGLNESYQVTHMNQAAEEWMGLREEEARGRLITQVYPPLSGYLEDIMRAQDERCPKLLEKQASTAGDMVQYYDVLIYPLASNGMQGVVLRVDDVTRRVRMEEMMVQTEKMMSVGGLAAGMAHEINNPLGAILQGAQNIERRLSEDLPANRAAADKVGCALECIRAYLKERQILVFLEGIRESGARAASIVANMLDFSRSSESRRSTVDMHKSLDRTVELAANDYDLKKRYDFRSIAIIRDYDPNLREIICSASEIEQVILNLLRNAAQAMQGKSYEQSGPCITIRTRQESQCIRIDVEDNGPGMSESVRKRVFEPFFTTKEIGVGTGLGLSVSYFIIKENHNGSFDVSSTPGFGTRFTIRLPNNPADTNACVLQE